MIALIILLALGAVSLCMCKAAGEADKYMEKLESRRELDE